jgi:hypothetical protein
LHYPFIVLLKFLIIAYIIDTVCLEIVGDSEHALFIVLFFPLCMVSLCAAAPRTGEFWERVDYFDDATRTMTVSLLKGDPRYPYLKSTKVVGPGAVKGTTDAVWTATYIAAGNAGPPENHKGMYIEVCQLIAVELKANPEAYA